ncbi:MAG TPA: redoxin domain-containing protein [Thermodesulfobacteriota bacterium]|nr:redoxin domain-containing protein [Thermodesulfobacteriota bacterium]
MNRYGVITGAFLILIAFLTVSMTGAGACADEIKAGKAAPDFTFTDIEGTTTKLSDFRGKYVVIEWFNHGCPFTEKHYKSDKMQDLQRKYTEEGVVWISVNSTNEGHANYQDAAMTRKEAEAYGTSATYIVLDPSGKIGKLYGAKTTPDIFIVDPQGKLIYAGAADSINSTDTYDIPKAENYIDLALTEAMAGTPVATPETKPYGCGVKYKE